MIAHSPLYRLRSPALVLLALATFLSGCTVDSPPPLAQDEAAGNGKVYLSFSDRAAQPAAKRGAGEDGVTKTKTAKPRKQSKLTVKAHRDLKAQLIIPKHAVAHSVKVTMTVYGSNLADLLVEFAPAGLEFLKPAILNLYLDKDLVNAELKAYHILADGTVLNATILSISSDGDDDDDDDIVLIAIEVPGFSRYNLSGGR